MGATPDTEQRGHQALLEHNAKVYMASRSKDKAEAAIRELKEQTGKEAIFLELDLSNLVSVRKAAEEFLGYAKHIFSIRSQYGLLTDWYYSKESALHVLFNNAFVSQATCAYAHS